MPNKVSGTVRIIIGILLAGSFFPPLSIRMLNPFMLIPVLIGLILIFLPFILRILRTVLGNGYRSTLRIVCVLLVLAGVFFASEFAVLFSHSFKDTVPDRSTVVVLGAKAVGGVPTIDLAGRIDAAAKYLGSHPQAVCIATGGRGGDETESEAQTIRNWLISRYGIESGRIYMDTTSKDTKQNFENARKIIREHGLPENVAVATDGFHMFRAKLIARRLGQKAYSCPAATDWRIAPTLYIRELFALPKTVLLDR